MLASRVALARAAATAAMSLPPPPAAPTAALALARRLVPPLVPHSAAHKGSHGRVAVVGGSFEYSGAPFYAALSALRTGADLAWIFCSRAAAAPIKSFSPEPIVLGVLPDSREGSRGVDGGDANASDDAAVAAAVSAFGAVAPRLHAVVVGPGLGRDALALRAAEGVLALCRARRLPTVLDGDALFLLAERPRLLDGAAEGGWPVVVTPNAAEFARLWVSSSAALAAGADGAGGAPAAAPPSQSTKYEGPFGL